MPETIKLIVSFSEDKSARYALFQTISVFVVLYVEIDTDTKRQVYRYILWRKFLNLFCSQKSCLLPQVRWTFRPLPWGCWWAESSWRGPVSLWRPSLVFLSPCSPSLSSSSSLSSSWAAPHRGWRRSTTHPMGESEKGSASLPNSYIFGGPCPGCLDHVALTDWAM